MRLLAIDPGETVGMVILEYALMHCPREEDEDKSVLASVKFIAAIDSPIEKFKQLFHPEQLGTGWEIGEVVAEDYRVFASKAEQHIGQRLVTAELIGRIEYVCERGGYVLHRVQPAKKGRWPEARLKAKFDWSSQVHGHARDALKIGLVRIEENARCFADVER